MSRNKSKPERKRLVWKKTGGICAHCGKQASHTRKTIDHFVPLSLGGGYDMRNLIPLCECCNREKSNLEIDALSYYSYASQDVLDACLEYKKEWEERGKSLAGDSYNSFQGMLNE